MVLRRIAVHSFVTGALLLGAAPASRAEAPVAPALAMEAAHGIARDAFGAIARALPAAESAKLTGAYVAFHGDPRDPVAFAACDDDGDYVVVLSDAMLVLADAVARAEANDASAGTQSLAAYAALLARETRTGQRLVPPPVGSVEADRTQDLARKQAARFRALATYLVAGEIAHVLSGDLVCPHPTATHERGDDVWTQKEHDAGLTLTAKFHDVRHVAVADAGGAALAARAGENEDAIASMLAPLMAAVEGSPAARAAVGYVRLHEQSLVRAQLIRTAAANSRARATDPPKP